MRLIKTITVVALVVLLPAISWYYLSKGAEWRKSGLKEISQRTQVTIPDLITHDSLTVSREDLFGNYVIAVDGQLVATSQSEKIVEQFGVRNNMRFLMIHPPTAPSAQEGWLHIPCTDSDCEALAGELFPGQTNAALLDDSLQLRQSYNLREVDELKRLIEHGAILVPPEKRDEIELVRGK